MRTLTIFGTLLIVLAISGCGFFPIIEGSGVLVDGSADFSNFSELQIEDSFVVRIVPGAQYGVTVRCDDNILEHVIMSKEGGIVSIRLEPFNTYINATLTAEVVMPEFHGLELSGASTALIESGYGSLSGLNLDISGASTVEIAHITTGAFNADISGASTLLGSVYATTSNVEVSGASNVELRGSTGPATLTVSGASDIDWYDYEADGLDVTLSGGSEGSVYVSAGTLKVDLTGASTLGYRGTPGNLVIDEISGGSNLYQF